MLLWYYRQFIQRENSHSLKTGAVHKQQVGQNGISWWEELRKLSDDASIDKMTTADLLYVIYVTGIWSNDLCEKLPEVSNPTIVKFDRVVDSFNQAKKQLGDMKQPANASQTSSRGRQRWDYKPPQTNGQNRGNGQRQEITHTNSREEQESKKSSAREMFQMRKKQPSTAKLYSNADNQPTPTLLLWLFPAEQPQYSQLISCLPDTCLLYTSDAADE